MIYNGKGGKKYRFHNERWQFFNVNRWDDLGANPQIELDCGSIIPENANRQKNMHDFDRMFIIEHSKHIHIELVKKARKTAATDAVNESISLLEALRQCGALEGGDD